MLEVAGQPLFLTRESIGEVEKVAAFKLGRDPAKWEKEIISNLYEQSPFLKDANVRIHINRSDPDSGTAVGQIVVDEKAAVPVVVDRFNLQPMDLFWHEGKLRPMTKTALQSAIQSSEIGTTVDPGQGELADLSIYNMTRAPFSGKYSFSSALEFTMDDLNKAMGKLGPEGLEYALRSNQIFKKAATNYAVNAKGKIMKLASARTPAKVNPIEFASFTDVDTAGAYWVTLGGTEKRASFLFDHVSDWHGELIDGMKMVLGIEDGDKPGPIAFAERVGGIPYKADLSKFASVHHQAPKTGDVGVFWMVKQGHAIATWPVRVLYRGSGDDMVPFLKVASLSPDGGERIIYQSDRYRDIHSVEEITFMSSEWSWMPVGSLVKVADAETANKIGWSPATCEIRHRGGVFTIRSQEEYPDLAKEGMDAESFYRALVPHMESEGLLQMMKRAEARGSAFFLLNKEWSWRPGKPMEKVAGIARNYGEVEPKNLIKAATFVTPCSGLSFFKIALDVSEPKAEETVDTLLSLNFVNDSNLYKFVEQVDQLEEAEDTLAKLLLASRLGLKLEQGPIRTAIFALDEVVRQLKQLRSIAYASDGTS